MVEESPDLAHPDDDALVAYLAHELSGEALGRVEEHLARCSQCRQVVLDAREVLRRPRRGRWLVLSPVAAAAALILFFVSGPSEPDMPPGQPVHRESPTELRVAPVPLSPVGSTGPLGSFVWNHVLGADRYRVILYNAEGTVLWRGVTSDSLISPPDSLSLRPGQTYLWRVEARTGWDVWEASDVVEFEPMVTGLPPSEEGGQH